MKIKRKIISIDESLCNGCGNCIPNCAEGALQVIDGKARLISDLFCDGLGACIGHCPTGAMTIEEREAEAYDEKKVMETIVKGGENVIKAHLQHLKDHGETGYFNEGIEYLKENNIKNPLETNVKRAVPHHGGGCPGSRTMDFRNEENIQEESGRRASQLRQWPVQLHLLNPSAPYFHHADVLLAADCTAFAVADFHKDFLKGKTLAIACPKLDSNQGNYLDKIIAMIEVSQINTLTVMIMEVPCCGGLVHIAQQAASMAKRKIPIKEIVVGLKGDIISERWL